MSTESVMLSNYLILCHPSTFAFNLPNIRVFSSQLFTSGGLSTRASASTSTSRPFNEYSGLISFRMDWFDLAIQGTSRVCSSTTMQKHHSSVLSLLYGPALTSVQFSSVQFISVAQSCPTLCNPMDCSTQGCSVLHYLWEFAQTHVHRVGDAI